MTPIIADASVAAKWFVQEDHREDAARLLDRPLPLAAPDFVLTELANIIWKKCIKGEITRDHAALSSQTAALAFQNIISATGLLSHALEIGLELHHPIYDCIYLACAADLGGFVVTADRRFHAKTRGTRFKLLVRYVTDVERVIAFSHLAVSLGTVMEIGELAGLSRATHDAVYKELKKGLKAVTPLPSDPMEFPSPNHERLRKALAELSAEEHSDLLALARFGDASPGEYNDWGQCRAQENSQDMEPYFLSNMHFNLPLGIERFLTGPP